MDFDMPPADDPRRIELRAWLDANPNPSGRQLAEAGLVAPHLPRPWGLDADPMHQLIIDDELSKAKVKRPRNDIGIGWATPTIIAAGASALSRASPSASRSPRFDAVRACNSSSTTVRRSASR